MEIATITPAAASCFPHGQSALPRLAPIAGTYEGIRMSGTWLGQTDNQRVHRPATDAVKTAVRFASTLAPPRGELR